MAYGDFTQLTFVDSTDPHTPPVGGGPAINATNLNAIESKLEELDNLAATPTADTIAERTAGAGVIIDGMLIKDGTIPGAFRGFIDGLICSNATDIDHDISIAAGSAQDSTGVYTLTLASAMVKQIDATWAAGTNAGGLDTGTVANSTVYYIWLIRKDSDASIDALFSTSSTAPTMPAGYTYKRQIMKILTDGSANILQFVQTDNYVMYKTPIEDRAHSAAGNTSRTAHTVSCPPSTLGIFGISASNAAATSPYYIWIDSSSRTDAAASLSNFTFSPYVQYAMDGRDSIIKTDSSKQIFSRADSTNVYFRITTRGYIVDRGENQ